MSSGRRSSMEPQIKNSLRKTPRDPPRCLGVGHRFCVVLTVVCVRVRLGFSRSSINREFEGKENGIDRFWKPSRVESPGPMKPTKHFKSSTISAVSKINASPRKKILAEKNELARCPWSSLNVSEEGSAARSEVEASESCQHIVSRSSSLRSRDSSTKKAAFHSEVQVIPSTDPDMLLCLEEEGELSQTVLFHMSDCDLDVTITDEMGETEEGLSFENPKDDAAEVKQAATKRPLLFTKSKLCLLILAALLLGIVTSGMHSPITISGVSIGNEWRDCEIIQEVGIGEYAKMNVDGAARNFGQLCGYSLDYIIGMINGNSGVQTADEEK
ncbi:hypothetical protein MLD38_013742 [Melastoma candidum]|uniref:Uncharacterized protein n=1 Tax=Melastoma candidum TaxID=119954 RepID=A0ACB9RAI9_9MYRT|nr:hypothetical protein MLD38_013742 [Melastoma candidum]